MNLIAVKLNIFKSGKSVFEIRGYFCRPVDQSDWGQVSCLYQ